MMSMHEAEALVYRSFLKAEPYIPQADDAVTRDIALTRRLLDAIGSPDEGMPTVLVTGSKGKGSTSRLISSLLSHHGYRVGLFTSPHLVSFTERIRVEGRAIPEIDFVRLMTQIRPFILEISDQLPKSKYLGPIGINLAIAMLYFKEQKTDIVVIECGRGGRFDDTNVLANSWAVITPIMTEHKAQLGPTLKHIAWHKLGIVKAMTQQVIIGRQKGLNLGEMKAWEDKQVHAFNIAFSAQNIRMTAEGTRFDVHTKLKPYPHLRLPLLGDFQADNAAVAIQTVEAITGGKLDDYRVKACFRSVQWPGRCEIVCRQPTIILDGAIHRESAEYLKRIVHALHPASVMTLIAVSEDKDYPGVIAVCASFSTALIVTAPEHSHKQFPKTALAVAKRYHATSQEILPLQRALSYAKAEAPELILIVGTQTAVGEAKLLLGHSLRNIGR
ncbi:bifunctional folylpolyglutamate synthase/dihydrofolate synthase [Pullulanibacillus camelliae]|nr:Mur ligase family protein [Pullulanibacillus camelliae]